MCGNVDPYATQRMEIFAETIRQANADEKIFPNVKMGFIVLDDCNINRVIILIIILFIVE